MPHVRKTPKRRRMTCPECGRDVAFTHPWVPNTWPGQPDPLMRDYGVAVFSAHNTPEGKGHPCPVNGTNGFGRSIR